MARHLDEDEIKELHKAVEGLNRVLIERGGIKQMLLEGGASIRYRTGAGCANDEKMNDICAVWHSQQGGGFFASDKLQFGVGNLGSIWQDQKIKTRKGNGGFVEWIDTVRIALDPRKGLFVPGTLQMLKPEDIHLHIDVDVSNHYCWTDWRPSKSMIVHAEDVVYDEEEEEEEDEEDEEDEE